MITYHLRQLQYDVPEFKRFFVEMVRAETIILTIFTVTIINNHYRNLTVYSITVINNRPIMNNHPLRKKRKSKTGYSAWYVS